MSTEFKATNVIIGCDHLGLEHKNQIRDHMQAQGITVKDIGVDVEDPVDYPDIGEALARRVASGEFDRGILVCGTGAGMAITANKISGVRAVCVGDPYTAERAIASNDARVITLGALVIGIPVAKMLVDIWLQAEFQGGGSAPKVAKMAALDQAKRS